MEEKHSLEHLIKVRKGKLEKCKNLNIDPYPNRFVYTYNIQDLIEKFSYLQEGEISQEKVVSKGRIILRREMGKTVFCHIQDGSGKIQIYLKSDILGEEKFNQFLELLDIGDIIGVEGEMFRTKTGELTINVKNYTLLSKSLRPLPEKWHGLKDVEVRYRQRYLDLISNFQVKDVFTKRSKIISTIREVLNNKGFLEVETPMIQQFPGGAIAQPFKTYHNALDEEFYFRIAPELYLKMLLIGGFEKIYELGKSFRNEGIDRFHNPEFTMVEIYQAYADYTTMMELMKDIFIKSCECIGDKDEITYTTIDNKNLKIEINNFSIESLPELFEKYVHVPLEKFVREEVDEDLLNQLGISFYEEYYDSSGKLIKEKRKRKKLIEATFEKYIQPHLINPTFVIDYPIELSPLAKAKPDNKNYAERFEFYVASEEIANAYSELNDPIEQYQRFLQQETPEEKMALNLDFISALEYGLPPAGGLGVGIDRLCMILLNQRSIRDVILFPLLKSVK